MRVTTIRQSRRLTKVYGWRFMIGGTLGGRTPTLRVAQEPARELNTIFDKSFLPWAEHVLPQTEIDLSARGGRVRVARPRITSARRIVN
jgi:hypothetical protein